MESQDFNRRNFIKTGLGAAGVAAMSMASVRADDFDFGLDDEELTIDKAAAECLRAGSLCLAHSSSQLSKGDTSFAKCHRSAQLMLISVETMLRFYAMDKKWAAQFAAICAELCKQCKEACFEHSEHWDHGMHLECKACYLSCIQTEKAARALMPKLRQR